MEHGKTLNQHETANQIVSRWWHQNNSGVHITKGKPVGTTIRVSQYDRNLLQAFRNDDCFRALFIYLPYLTSSCCPLCTSSCSPSNRWTWSTPEGFWGKRPSLGVYTWIILNLITDSAKLDCTDWIRCCSPSVVPVVHQKNAVEKTVSKTAKLTKQTFHAAPHDAFRHSNVNVVNKWPDPKQLFRHLSPCQAPPISCWIRFIMAWKIPRMLNKC